MSQLYVDGSMLDASEYILEKDCKRGGFNKLLVARKL